MQKISVKSYSIAAVLLVLIIVAIVAFYFPLIPTSPKTSVLPTPAAVHHKVAYKIRLDSADIVYGKVGNNQNLSSLLSAHVSGAMIDKIAKETQDVFDLKKIHAGNTFARIFSKDSTHRTLCFVYQINPIDFVVYDFRDSLRVYRDKKTVTRLVKTASGTIKSSLWNCFVENKLDVNLGMALSDVYAWTIDFYGLQKGDHFKVIYEELFVDNVMVGIDRILASTFNSNGKDFHAYNFDQDGKGQFFDENGQSLQRSFLKAPLKFSHISSRFTGARLHPILRIVRPHYGVDYAAPRGTPVVSLGEGRVAEAGFHGGYGRFISIRHNSVYTTTYAHLSGYAKGLKPGSRVQQGEVIGYVGSSGLATGPHLDFRVYRNGSPTDPLKLESPPSKPVDPKELLKFKQLVQKMNLELEKK
ncbi:MAG: peptidoglycan DD-metalloendopeptidase family protein [Bacteroidota bacterium]